MSRKAQPFCYAHLMPESLSGPMSDPKVGEVRERVWTMLMKERALAYPYPPFGHHPNFRGAAQAANLLLPELLTKKLLKPGDTVLSYPDYVLKGLRKGLLEAGINVVVPGKYKGWRLLESAKVRPAKVSSIAGAEKEGEKLDALPPVTLTFVACVALTKTGDLLTKGYGFSLPSEVRELPSFSVAHPLQVLETLPEADAQVTAFATLEEVVWSK